MKTLNSLKINQKVVVRGLIPNGVTSKLVDMGLYTGKEVQIIYRAPFGGPIAIDIDGYTLSLRREEAETVEVD